MWLREHGDLSVPVFSFPLLSYHHVQKEGRNSADVM